MEVFSKFLWLEGCDAEQLASEERMETLLRAAVDAGAFELDYTHVSNHDGRTVALAVIGESHLVMHGEVDARTLVVEVVSCTTEQAAVAALEAVKASATHSGASERHVEYRVDEDMDV